MAYSTARLIFEQYIAKAGLAHKGYSLHALRHTFASELLNAGMRIECLQPLMGHTSLDVTLRYARLSNPKVRRDYFNAMEVIMQQTACTRNSRQSKGVSGKAELPTAASALLR
jgi:integrase